MCLRMQIFNSNSRPMRCGLDEEEARVSKRASRARSRCVATTKARVFAAGPSLPTARTASGGVLSSSFCESALLITVRVLVKVYGVVT